MLADVGPTALFARAAVLVVLADAFAAAILALASLALVDANS